MKWLQKKLQDSAVDFCYYDFGDQDESRILVIEMDCGQYLREIERLATNHTIQFLGRMNGESITPNEIPEVLQSLQVC